MSNRVFPGFILLAPILWAQLSIDEQPRLSVAHRQRYYGLANYLYHSDKKTPHGARAIARLELPNLLHAADAMLDARRPLCHGVCYSREYIQQTSDSTKRPKL